MQGAVLEGMKPTDKPVAGEKNDPMMPLVWIKSFENDSGKKNNIFCTTMGSSTDFESEHLRRLIVNATYWAAGLQDKGWSPSQFTDTTMANVQQDLVRLLESGMTGQKLRVRFDK